MSLLNMWNLAQNLKKMGGKSWKIIGGATVTQLCFAFIVNDCITSMTVENCNLTLQSKVLQKLALVKEKIYLDNL